MLKEDKMNISCTALYEKQLKNILEEMSQIEFDMAKKFKLYLDTVIINVPTKAKKYKPSIYFDDESIRDIVHEGYIIPFYISPDNNNYLIIGILKENKIQ
jgi:hypothetical protein